MEKPSRPGGPTGPEQPAGSALPNQDCPVHIGPLTPGDPHRTVRVMRADGTITPAHPCRDAHELKRLVHHERPDADLGDPAQLFWADHPGLWPS